MAINDGLIHHWSPTLDPNAGSGTQLTDLAGLADGTLSGGVSWENDATGNGLWALLFDGTNGIVQASSALFNTLEVSVSTWVKFPGDQTSTAGYVLLLGSITSYRVLVSHYGGNDPGFNAGWSSSAGAWRRNGGLGQTNTWYHIVWTYSFSSTANNAIEYLNANQETPNRTGNPSGSPVIDATGQIDIGDRRSDYARSFRGSVDSIRVYDRILSQAEVTELFNAGRAEDGIAPPPGTTFQPAWAAGRTTRIIQGSVNV